MTTTITQSHLERDRIPAPSNRPTISWGAVLAGTVAAIAIQIGLAQLCVAAGLAMYTPFQPAEPTGAIAMGTIIAWVICALLGLFAGGWVAGRLAHFQSQTIAGLHGMLVWGTGAVIASGVVALTVAALAGGAAKVATEGVKVAAQSAEAIGSTVASVAAPSWDAVRDQLKEAGSKVAAAAKEGELETRYADQSRTMDLAGKFFTVDKQQRLTPAERDELATLLAPQLGIRKESAVKTLDQWERSWDAGVARYEAAKEEAKAKAQEAAIAAKKFTAAAAAISFGLMLVGLIAAIAGGIFGSHCFRREEERNSLTSHSRMVPA